jgi:hypothetical protein
VARGLHSVRQRAQIFGALIFESVLSIELKLVLADGTRLRILQMPSLMRPVTYRKLKCLANEGCDRDTISQPRFFGVSGRTKRIDFH